MNRSSPPPRPPQIPQIGIEVSLEQPLRVLQQAVEPLEVMFLHPLGGALDVAGFVVEGGADADHQGTDTVLMGGHPALLLGGAEPHPDKVRLRCVDLLDDLHILLGCQLPEGRRVHPRDDRARVALLDLLSQQVQRLLGGAVEVVPPALPGADRQNLLHQVGAGHTAGFREALLAAVLGQRSAVRQGHDCVVLDLLVAGVLVGRDRCVDVGHADVLAAPAFQLALDQREGLAHARDHDVDPHHLAGLAQVQVHRVQAGIRRLLGVGIEKIAVDRHHAQPDVVTLGQGHQMPHLVGVLHILGCHDPVHLVLGQHFGHAALRPQIVRQARRFTPSQIPHIFHTFLFGDHVLIITAGQCAPADQQDAGRHIMAAGVGRADFLEDPPLYDDRHHRQHIEIGQQQAGKLRQAEHIQHGGRQRKADQAGDSDPHAFPDEPPDADGLVAALEGVDRHHDARIEQCQREIPLDIEEEKQCAPGGDDPQEAGQYEGQQQDHELGDGIEDVQWFGSFVVHNGYFPNFIGWMYRVTFSGRDQETLFS